MQARGSRSVQPANLHAGFLVRMVLLASIPVIGAAWGLVRFYTRVRAPKVDSVGIDAGGWDAGAGLIEAPEIEVEKR
jgi:hypothetical protein